MVMCITRCGLFTPGNAENPDPIQIPIEDPLNLRHAVDNNTGEYLPFQDYEYLFNDNFIYYDGNKPEEKFEKARILNRVNIIEQNYLKITDRYKINITWSHDDIDDPYEENKIITLKPRKYEAYLIHHIDTIITGDSTTYIPTYVFRYFGEATFNLKFNTDRNEWNIVKWIDTKTSGAGDKPFFHPNFILPSQ
jgi:hypothetical protein